MHLKFGKNDFEKFKKLQNIKDNPSKIEENLIKKTVNYTKYIKWVPGLQMIAIGNSVAMNNANTDSDIDLFVVSKTNRLWIVRIIITLIFQIFGIRKTKNNHKSRFCLSFFCTTTSLNFENIAIKNDIYLYFWMIYLKPILNYDKTYEKFIEENKKWCNFDDYKDIIKNNKNYIVYKQNTSKYNCKLINLLEKFLKSIFIPKTKKSFKEIGKPFGVIINDNMLKFHNNDKRKKIRDTIPK
ncbi:MAG: hypothetical protein WC850_02580 [Candidatus Gracilibacteria bacterium]